MLWWKFTLVIGMAVCFVGVLVIPALREYFELLLPDARDIASAVGIGVIASAIIEAGWRLTDWSIPQQVSAD